MASNVVPNFLSRNENSPPALIDPKFLSRSVRGLILTANPRLFRGYALQNDAVGKIWSWNRFVFYKRGIDYCKYLSLGQGISRANDSIAEFGITF